MHPKISFLFLSLALFFRSPLQGMEQSPNKQQEQETLAQQTLDAAKNNIDKVKKLTDTLTAQQIADLLCTVTDNNETLFFRLTYKANTVRRDSLKYLLERLKDDENELYKVLEKNAQLIDITMQIGCGYTEEITQWWKDLLVQTLKNIKDENRRQHLVFEMKNKQDACASSRLAAQESLRQCFEKPLHEIQMDTLGNKKMHCLLRLAPALFASILSLYSLSKNIRKNAILHLSLNGTIAGSDLLLSYFSQKDNDQNMYLQAGYSPRWSNPRSLASIAKWTIMGALSLPHLKTLTVR